MNKMKDPLRDMSIADLSQDDRAILKEYLSI
jgi:hypothetical protein